MRKEIALMSSLFILGGCSGPSIVAYGSEQLTYDAGTWETFENGNTKGLNAKGDQSCWIDLTGNLTTPDVNGYEAVEDEGLTIYFSTFDDTAAYVTFALGDETVNARVSVEDTDNCLGKLLMMADSN